jgi:hypothetical protein
MPNPLEQPSDAFAHGPSENNPLAPKPYEPTDIEKLETRVKQLEAQVLHLANLANATIRLSKFDGRGWWGIAGEAAMNWLRKVCQN